MSAITKTQICNMAISNISGKRMITDFDTDDSTAGELCRVHFDICRDATLREHPWNFAIKRVELALSTDTISYEYTNAFALPADCLKVLRTQSDAMGWSIADTNGTVYDLLVPFRIEANRRLLTNDTSVKIEYIARIEDTAMYDPMFVQALAARLAMAICMPLTSSEKQFANMNGLYDKLLSMAKTIDAQEGTARDIVDLGQFLRSRF